MKLSDLIIEHGPYEAGDLHPFAGGVDRGDLNELREELIAARAMRELGERFEVYGVPFSGNEIIGIRHDGCPGRWHAEIEDFAQLAELSRRAAEHAEVCR